MKTFKQFLHEQADHIRADVAVRESKKREWVEAVERLIDQATQWLRESDEEHILSVSKMPISTSEPSLGSYDISMLMISLGSRTIYVSPVAYEVLGPGIRRPGDKELGGRVDITGGPFTYLLYRYVDHSGQESWQMIDDRNFQSQTFTRESLDSALVSLFG